MQCMNKDTTLTVFLHLNYWTVWAVLYQFKRSRTVTFLIRTRLLMILPWTSCTVLTNSSFCNISLGNIWTWVSISVPFCPANWCPIDVEENCWHHPPEEADELSTLWYRRTDDVVMLCVRTAELLLDWRTILLLELELLRIIFRNFSDQFDDEFKLILFWKKRR